MTSEEWLEIIESAADYTDDMKKNLTPLIKKYGDMCKEEVAREVLEQVENDKLILIPKKIQWKSTGEKLAGYVGNKLLFHITGLNNTYHYENKPFYLFDKTELHKFKNHRSIDDAMKTAEEWLKDTIKVLTKKDIKGRTNA